MLAFHGRYLRIDVTRGSVERIPLSETLLRQYLGGSGLGARLLLDEAARTRIRCHRKRR
jgi:aldehyde:ferredoxin oxidoreductase